MEDIVADKKARSRSQIESDIAAARVRLSSNVESLIDQVHPSNVKQRQLDNVKSFANTEFNNAKRQFKSDDGWRTDRIALIGGSVVGFVTFLVIVRAIVNKAKKRNQPQYQ